MTWEEALEAHVKENEQQFNRVAQAFGELRTFVAAQIMSVTDRIDHLESDMHAQFEAVDKRFTAIDERFDAIDTRFEAIDRRFDNMETRFTEVGRRFDRLDGQIDLIVKTIVRP